MEQQKNFTNRTRTTTLLLVLFGCTVLLLLRYDLTYAAVHYVSPMGSAVWANSTDISTPTSLSNAFNNAQAGDLVYMLDGTYASSGNYYTAHSGTGDADSQRIIFRAYPGTTPDLVNINTGQGTIMVEHNYWTFDGLTVHSTFNNASAGDRGCVYVGYNHATNGLKIINCHLVISYSATFDNVAAVIIKNASQTLVQNNLLEGYTLSGCGGVQAFNGTGLKVLNNEVRNFAVGLFQKHPNCDVSYASGAEWGYNYVHNIGSAGQIGRGAYINFHDNLFVHPDGAAIRIGTDGGGSCMDGYSVWNHNTLVGGWETVGVGMPNGSFKNNVVTTRRYFEATYGMADYNIYGMAEALGSHDQGNTAVNFIGGTSPSTIMDYALSENSNGKNDGDDGKDLGANISLVGIQLSGSLDVISPAVPQSLVVR